MCNCAKVEIEFSSTGRDRLINRNVPNGIQGQLWRRSAGICNLGNGCTDRNTSRGLNKDARVGPERCRNSVSKDRRGIGSILDCTARTRCHGHVSRIKQPLPAYTTGRSRIDAADNTKAATTGSLDRTACSTASTTRGNFTRGLSGFTRPEDRRSAIAITRRIDVNAAACLLRDACCFADGSILALPTPAHQHLTTAGSARCIQLAGRGQRNAASGRHDLAAGLAGVCALSQKRARDPRLTLATIEPDFAIATRQRHGLDRALLVDGRAQRVAGAIGRQPDASAIGADKTAVLHFGGGIGIDRDGNQPARA